MDCLVNKALLVRILFLFFCSSTLFLFVGDGNASCGTFYAIYLPHFVFLIHLHVSFLRTWHQGLVVSYGPLMRKPDFCPCENRHRSAVQ